MEKRKNPGECIAVNVAPDQCGTCRDVTCPQSKAYPISKGILRDALKSGIEDLLKDAKDAVTELSQLHATYYKNCKEGCPTLDIIRRLGVSIASVESLKGATASREQPSVVVEVSGGNGVDIYSTTDEMNIYVVDHDNFNAAGDKEAELESMIVPHVANPINKDVAAFIAELVQR